MLEAIDDRLLDAVALVESGNKAHAVNPKSGACGAYQFMPATYREEATKLGIQPADQDPFNPAQARTVARAYLNTLWHLFGERIEFALAAYNWGLGNLRKVLSHAEGNPEWDWVQYRTPMETQLYVKKVMAAYQRRQDITVG